MLTQMGEVSKPNQLSTEQIHHPVFQSCHPLLDCYRYALMAAANAPSADLLAGRIGRAAR
jgi:hypothetical protein